MAEISIQKKDVLWSYLAKFFNLATGLITLPLILRMLSSDELGMNYLMMTIASMVALLDFGFSPQFGRNFTYVNSGAQTLQKEGLSSKTNSTINYKLLSTLLETARYVYRRLALVCFLIMVSLGTIYIYIVTNGFSNVKYSFIIWILFSITTYFNVYFTWYNSLLTGSGKVAEANKGILLSRVTYLVICYTCLLSHLGLFSIVIANLISPFVQRAYSHQKYFTKELKSQLVDNVSSQEVSDLFKKLWYNAKKLGINFIGAYAINKSGLFVIGLFLPLSTIGSFGLLTQLAAVLLGISQTLFSTYQPKFSNCRVINDREEFKNLMYLTTFVYWLFMIIGSLMILHVGPEILKIIGSRTELPSMLIVVFYMITVTLEGNHSNFATLIATGNNVPFVKSGLLSGIAIVVITVFVLKYSNLGLLGVVLTQLIVQLAYNNWRWPLWVLREYDLTFSTFMGNCLMYVFRLVKNKI